MVTRKQAKEIKDDIAEIKERLQLQQWDIEVKFMDQDTERKHYAMAQVSANYWEATIEIYPNYFTLNEEKQYLCLTHELCHIITQDMVNLCWDLRHGLLIHQETITKVHEQLTEKIARLVQ